MILNWEKNNRNNPLLFIVFLSFLVSSSYLVPIEIASLFVAWEPAYDLHFLAKGWSKLHVGHQHLCFRRIICNLSTALLRKWNQRVNSGLYVGIRDIFRSIIVTRELVCSGNWKQRPSFDGPSTRQGFQRCRHAFLRWFGVVRALYSRANLRRETRGDF